MSLSTVRLEEDLHPLLGFGSAPSRLLPGFVHEATHHWCFLSPVGFTLSHLQLRARRNGVLLHNAKGDAATLHRLFGDVVRYETALALLRPLAEGLALFAEFDALSGPASSAFSTPTELVGWLFSGGVEGIRFGPVLLPYEGTRRPLIEWRQTDHCLRRKESIFGHPFEVANGGYLPGYLAVRQLWFQLAEQDHRLLNESDLFLMFLRSFFYDDYGLVALLLDDAPAGFETTEAIVAHIAGRFNELRKVDAAQILRFERAVASEERQKDGGWAILSDTLTTDKDAAARGRRMADEMLKALETPDIESVEGLLALWDMQIHERRDIIHFGHLDVQVEVDDNRGCHVTADAKTIDVGSCLPGVRPGSGLGSLDLICSALTGTKARAVTVRRGDELVAVFFGGPNRDDKHLQQRFMQLGDPRSLQAGTDEMKGYMDGVLAWEGIAEMVAEMRALLPRVCEEIYAVNALPHVSGAQRAQAMSAMREDGLLPLLSWDRSLINGVALLSLAWSLRLRRPQTTEFLADHEIALDPILAAVKACGRKYGIPMIWDAGDLLLCSV